MTSTKKPRSAAAWLLLSITSAALLAACGGGSSSREDASARAANKFPAAVVPALASSEQALPSKAARDDDDAAVGVAARRAERLYIVQLAEPPAVAYDGSIAGYAATRPGAGRKLDPNAPAVLNYADYLMRRHDAVLAAVGGGRKAYSYVYGYNGFAAEISATQAAQLATSGGVLSVVRNELRQLDTATTPTFLGLNNPGSLWSRNVKGENVIIGVIDGGITPEHPSFSDRTDSNGNETKDGKLGYQQVPGWNGKCQPGAAFNASHCNQKLIGARFYNEGYGGAAGVLAVLPYEFISPRDYDGHGTHTASTAGGNANVQATGLSSAFGKISGIAPRARIAAYKVCWGIGGTPNAGCSTVDSVAAIDQAIADGVDVINYSISGTRTNFRDPVEIAFLRAADAGIFVATSAGNAGATIGTSSVAHPSPWVTTVAAGTHNRDGVGSATLGDGSVMSGASYANPIGPKPLIRSRDAGLAGADTATLALCFGSADGGARLDPAKVAGKIVVCERGGNVLVNKAAAVKAAGGVGMLLVNTPTSNQTTLALVYNIPAVHLASSYYAALDAYAQTAGATATINGATIVDNLPAPLTASFSSRGPLLAGGGDLLKPDLIAPGQDILAAVAPYTYGGESFSLLSGTSMSSPHVAGLAALLKEFKPGWSPMAIKSALMTSGYDVLDNVATATRIFRQGAGHVRPNSAMDPGLVFDSSFNDWLGFLCGTQLPVSFCSSAGVPVLDASNLNVASIAIGDMAGTQTVKRRVTSVGAQSETYTASVSGMAGFTVTLPAAITVAPGASKDIEVGFLRTSAALNGYSGGQLTLTGDRGHVVRLPVVVRPVALAAPTQVSGSYTVTFGYDGPFTATARGLVPAALTNDTVLDDPGNGDCALNTPNAKLIAVTVPAGITYARFALFDADSPGADIDLCVFNSAGTFVGGSGSATSAEEVNLATPAPGVYTVVVHGFDTGAAGSPFKLHSWLLGEAAAGNMTVSAPAAAVTGATGTITLGFSGLAAGQRYLGSVVYGGTTGLPAPTLVRIDN